MKFTVIWGPNAEQELASIWLAAMDRSKITIASSRIDQLLSHDPDTVGEQSFDTVRTLIVTPLGVDFEVLIEDCLVSVLSVWLLDNPPT